MAKVKPLFFTSKHYGWKVRKYNEIHPCRINYIGFREHGWYLNSFMKYSRFRGYRWKNISVGLVSGYRRIRVPYITIHTDDGFIAPTFLLGLHSPALVVCTYGERSIRGSFKQVWRKLREKKPSKKTATTTSIKTETTDAN